MYLLVILYLQGLAGNTSQLEQASLSSALARLALKYLLTFSHNKKASQLRDFLIGIAC
jgi:hypothetical protein